MTHIPVLIYYAVLLSTPCFSVVARGYCNRGLVIIGSGIDVY